MNELDELNVVNAIFDNFANGVTVIHPNEKFDGESTEWIRLTIQPAKGEVRTLGDLTFRYNSILYVQVFVSPDSGSGRSMELVSEITNLLRAKTINGLTFKVPTYQDVGTKNGWYQINVLTEFYRED